MKLVAYYLPQFHETEENNDFWGEGYTEWVNVKKAKKIYFGHVQPRKPLNDDYYDLKSGKKIIDHMDLAKKYGIDAFCFYHYWFGNGKQILNIPVDNMRKNYQATIEYCFCWANETWTKTWNGGNGNREILVNQEYCGEEDWEKHFNYLLPFFSEEKYLKVYGKPVFLVFNMQDIPVSIRDKMFALWEEKAVENGFPGICLITVHIGYYGDMYCKYSCGDVDFEPTNTRRLSRETNSVYVDILEKLWKCQDVPVINRLLHRKISYKKTNEIILRKKHKKNYFRSIFVGYDDTPRRGYRATVYTGTTPAVYGKYLRKSLLKSKNENNELFFIYAWNEWGEGGYLEPDSRYKYRFLEMTKKMRNGI